MKTRYRLTCRGIRGGKYYFVDNSTGKRTSLRTTNQAEARQLVEAKNNSERQPVLNLHIAKAYLAGSDNGITTRTWQNAIDSLIKMKEGANQERWKAASRFMRSGHTMNLLSCCAPKGRPTDQLRNCWKNKA